MGVFAEMGKTLEQASTSMISHAVENIINAITPAVTTGVIIYFMITGYMVLAGRISEPIGDVCIKAFKIALVATLCLSTSGIMNYVVAGVNGIETMFVQAISGNKENTFQMIDDSFNKGVLAAANAVEQANGLGITKIGTIFALYLSGISISIATILMTVLAAALLMLAKVSLAVILGLSPFFLAGLMFPITARWADSWFSQALNYAILAAIVIFIMTLSTTFFSNEIKNIEKLVTTGSPFPIKSLMNIIVISAVMTFVLKSAPSIASGLAGGAASAGASLTGMVVQSKQMGNWVDSARGAYQKDKGRVVHGANQTGRAIAFVGRKTGATAALQAAGERTGISPTIRRVKASIERFKSTESNSIKKQ